MKSGIFFASLFLLATANASNPCNTTTSDLFSIDGAGKVNFNPEAKKYTIEKSEKQIKLSRNKNLKMQSRIVWIGLDDSGKVSTVGDSGVMYMFPRLNTVESHLQYKDGQCFVEKITRKSGDLIVDTNMCNELVPLFQKNAECLNRCSSGFDSKIQQIITKHGGTIDEIKGDESALGIKYPAPATAQAQLYLNRCANPVVKESMDITRKGLADGKASETDVNSGNR